MASTLQQIPVLIGKSCEWCMYLFYPVLIGLFLIIFHPGAVAVAEEMPFFINNDVTCGNINGKWLPGVMKRGKRFVAYQTTLSKVKKQMQSASSEKRLKLENKKKKFQLLHRTGKKQCKAGPPDGSKISPTPTITPGGKPHPSQGTPIPGPTPTPKPPAQKGCFNAQGQTTCFGIGAAGYIGEVSKGKIIFDNGSNGGTACSGCHSEFDRRNRTYGEVKVALETVPEMMPYKFDFSGSDIAHVVAYLNRFND